MSRHIAMRVALFALALLAASGAEGARGLLRPPDPNPSRRVPTPIVMWHGMGDNCCDPVSMGHLKGIMEASTPGLFVKNVMTGPNPWLDTVQGFFGDVNHQVKETCERLLNEPRLANGFFAVGFSQGGQFMRAVVQRCGGGVVPGDGKLIVKRLVTLGGQHAGVSAFPGCGVYDNNATLSAFCRAASEAVEHAAYSFLTRTTVVQAQYYYDPMDYETYLAKNQFLPDVNNERHDSPTNEMYKENLLALERLVLIRFSEDTVVVPKDSAWFGRYRAGTTIADDNLVQLRESDWYKNDDALGLRTLDESGTALGVSQIRHTRHCRLPARIYATHAALQH